MNLIASRRPSIPTLRDSQQARFVAARMLVLAPVPATAQTAVHCRRLAPGDSSHSQQQPDLGRLTKIYIPVWALYGTVNRFRMTRYPRDGLEIHVAELHSCRQSADSHNVSIRQQPHRYAFREPDRPLHRESQSDARR